MDRVRHAGHLREGRLDAVRVAERAARVGQLAEGRPQLAAAYGQWAMGDRVLDAARADYADGREQRLKRALEPLRPRYDFILIDCPPALSLLTLNALTAADSVLVPMQCEYYALEGLTSLLQTIDAIKQSLNPQLEVEGVLRTMFDVRNNLANAVSGELTSHFGDKVFRTIVPRNVRVAEAPSHGQSIVGYDRASRGGVAYLGLAGEVLRRQRERDSARKQEDAE